MFQTGSWCFQGAILEEAFSSTLRTVEQGVVANVHLQLHQALISLMRRLDQADDQGNAHDDDQGNAHDDEPEPEDEAEALSPEAKQARKF